ncbi:hypothetical protein IAU60_006664 [Kwoniella sp. DSM 27419]
MRPSPLLTMLAAVPIVSAVHLTDSLLNQVYNVMNDISTASWENGTRAEAILEASYASLSVFSSNPFPLPSNFQSGQIPQIIDIAQVTMQNRPASSSSSSSTNGSTLLEDGAAGDPASLGITILLANASTNNQQINGVGYGDAATAELNYLLHTVPRAPNGAISHRTDQAQLWSDSVYMVPPFLAYYGVLHNNQTLVEEAYNQIAHYRQVLATSNGLWSHILLGNGTYDPGLWATGNAWAAAGMLRVWATIKRSQFSDALSSQANDLQSWIGAIFDAAQGYITDDGLFHNYLNDSSTFKDTSGAALFAATGFRLSTLGITDGHVMNSIKLLTAVSSHVNSTGYLGQVVNPFDFGKQGTVSSEGQSFVVMAYAAYKEWDSLGRKGYDSKDDPLGKYSAASQLAGVPGVATVLCGALLVAMGWTVL